MVCGQGWGSGTEFFGGNIQQKWDFQNFGLEGWATTPPVPPLVGNPDVPISETKRKMSLVCLR